MSHLYISTVCSIPTTGTASYHIYVSAGDSEMAAETAMPEVLEEAGFTNAQIGRMLGRMRTAPMKRARISRGSFTHKVEVRP